MLWKCAIFFFQAKGILNVADLLIIHTFVMDIISHPLENLHLKVSFTRGAFFLMKFVTSFVFQRGKKDFTKKHDPFSCLQS